MQENANDINRLYQRLTRLETLEGVNLVTKPAGYSGLAVRGAMPEPSNPGSLLDFCHGTPRNAQFFDAEQPVNANRPAVARPEPHAGSPVIAVFARTCPSLTETGGDRLPAA